MSFAQFMTDVPAAVRLLMAIVLTAGISMLLVWRLHDRILSFASNPDDDDHHSRRSHDSDRSDDESEDSADRKAKDTEPRPPKMEYLAGRVMAMTSVGFVFLFAFVVSNCWSNDQDARNAVQQESVAYSTAVTLAKSLPADKGGASLVTALQAYGESVENVQWPLMQSGARTEAFAAQGKVVEDLGNATELALEAGASKEPQWSIYIPAAKDLVSGGTSRLESMPNPGQTSAIMLVFVLGLSNLALAATFQPTRLGPNLFLIGVMATIIALMLFLTVEVSSPYLGGVALTPAAFGN